MFAAIVVVVTIVIVTIVVVTIVVVTIVVVDVTIVVRVVTMGKGFNIVYGNIVHRKQ